MTIGFIKPDSMPRIPVRNDQGLKVAYIASSEGRQIIQSVNGQTIAVVKRWKGNIGQRVGASSGTIMRY